MSVSKPHNSLDELFVPRNELLDVLERRFLAKDGTPWADIEELERQAYALVRGLQEQYQALRDLIDGAGWHFDDGRLGYIEIQVDRDAFIALRPDAFPASRQDG